MSAEDTDEVQYVPTNIDRDVPDQPRGPLRLARGTGRIAVLRPPSHDQVAFDIPAGDVNKIDVKERAGKPADTGTVELDDYGGKYSEVTSEFALRMDDRLVFQVGFEGSTIGMGEGPMGVGPMGSWQTRGDWIVTDPPEIEAEGQGGTITLSCMDFVWGILQERRAFYREEDAPIAGVTPTQGDGEESHLNRILDREADEIDRSQIMQVDKRIDYQASSRPLTDVVDDLSQQLAVAEGSAIAYGDGKSLVFQTHDRLPRPFSGTDPNTGIAYEPFGPIDFMGSANSAGDGKGIVNWVRVDGGIDSDNIDLNPNESFDRYEEVSETQQRSTQITVRKSQIPKIQIWTRGDIDSDNSGLRVRVQPSNEAGTGPIDPGDTNSDIVSSAAREIAISDEDWTIFPLPGGVQHAVAERNPWLIVDTTGEDPYEIGVSADGSPMYRIFFSKPIVATAQSDRSLNTYLRHEQFEQDDSLSTIPSTRERANALVSRRPFPVRVVEVTAASPRAHSLRVGDIIDIEYPRLRVGIEEPQEMVVVGRQTTYSGKHVNTTLEMTGIGALSRVAEGT